MIGSHGYDRLGDTPYIDRSTPVYVGQLKFV